MITPIKRICSSVAAALFALLIASPVMAQGPLGFQLFAPADNSSYGGGMPPNEGYFFQFDILYWNISKPRVTTIGFNETPTVYYPPTSEYLEGVPTVETNDFDTGGIESKFSIGNRFEFGRIEDRNGWMVDIFQLRNQGSSYNYLAGDVVFHDVNWEENHGYLNGYVSSANPDVRLPVIFYDVTIKNEINLWGVEAMYLHQFRTGHHGGNLEFFAGARYLEFNERFIFRSGADPGIGPQPSFLAGSSWVTEADNHLIGPQIGGRYWRKRGRWTISTEGRFLAAMNCTNVHQDVNLIVTRQGTPYHPLRMSTMSTTHDVFDAPFSPLVELRVEARYQITRTISFHAGWTGFWVDNISRPSEMVVYSLEDTMGIDIWRKDSVFVNGVTIGFDINR